MVHLIISFDQTLHYKIQVIIYVYKCIYIYVYEYVYKYVYVYEYICLSMTTKLKSSLGDCSGRVRITFAANFLYFLYFLPRSELISG